MTTFLILALCVVVLWAGIEVLKSPSQSLIAATIQSRSLRVLPTAACLSDFRNNEQVMLTLYHFGRRAKY